MDLRLQNFGRINDNTAVPMVCRPNWQVFLDNPHETDRTPQGSQHLVLVAGTKLGVGSVLLLELRYLTSLADVSERQHDAELAIDGEARSLKLKDRWLRLFLVPEGECGFCYRICV